MNVSSATLDPKGFLKEHFVLPPLPVVVQKLLERLSSDQANAKEVAELLAADVGLVAQIMKIVNSAYYGLPHPIRDVKHAVAYLGLGEIKRVALTVSVMEQMAPQDSGEFERFWRHSFHTALTAKTVAKTFARGIDPEELYVSALLHDVGKLVYMKFFPTHYREMADYCTRNSAMMTQAEERLGYPSHTLFGAVLCDRWLFAESVKDACRCHELEDLKRINADSAVGNDDLRVICVSNMLGNLIDQKLSVELNDAIQREVITALGCSDDEFVLLMSEAHQLKSEVEQFVRGF